MDKNTVYKRTLSQAKERLTIVQEQEKEFNKQVSNNNKQIKQISIKNKKLAKKISSHMKYMNQLVSEITEKSKKEEPQWEILAYVVNNGVRCTLRSNGKYLNEEFESNNNWGGTLEDVLKYIEKGEGFIESVKRFPDNTVWSVDMVTNNGRITGFHIEKGIMVAEFENNTRHCDLMLLIKAPKETPKPEWEIDSFYHVDYGVMFKDAQNHYQHVSNCGRGWCISLDEALKNTKNMSIHTVKRLSDGEVFSVGDYVEYAFVGASDNFYTPHLIKRFEIKDGVMNVQGEVPELFNFTLISCKKSKAPKEEQVPIKVAGIGYSHDNQFGRWYHFGTSKPIEPEKYTDISKAIEDVLNNKYKPWKMYQTGFTSEELLQAIRDAFHAGRSFDCWNVSSHQYAKFEDYINSIK